ncbi:MAG: UDP-N-acetylmuramoyl-L-alanyl-D-glutamate--2,6-diaminopimelate ligase [Solirubrobacteraceae bacterium]|nr:UDP-N-acetylmuramoyl-L-alanyl-D-glutamate--2,6-diaminopimelate ligase [Solirubrobacteraceae bacterium]
MLLSEVIGRDAPAVDVTALAYDARAVTPGTLFFCVPGFTRDGHDFAAEAIERGAVALVVQRPLGLGVPEVVVEDVRAAMAPAAAALAGDPTARLTTIGITGTSGKTTSAYLVRALLQAAGRQTGLLGTVTAIVGGEQRPAARTTPEAIDLQRTFAEMLAAGDDAVVMEVSSHALALHRADAIHWTVAAFTNLTQDHLDFHADMEDYFAAKRRLFESDPEMAVINVDDPYGARLARDFPAAIRIGVDAADAQVRAVDLAGDATGSSFTVDGMALRTALPGRFNVLNALGAVTIARALGVDDATIERALPRAGRVPGRFEPIDEGQPFAVFVDYSHKPDALEAVLRTARDLTGGDGRLIVVFGAGGDRDRGKRPLMGRAAATVADVAIVTSDNPRSEDPEAIIDEVARGASEARGRAAVERIVDRREAIERAVALAGDGDVVVVAGKGHERYQEFEHGRTVPFDDVAVAREALRRGAAAPGRR